MSDVGYAAALVRLERALTFGINPSLEGIGRLTGALGRPHDAYRCVQVTGTNGKTSVTRMLGAVLRAHGLRTGVYTSPHLTSYTERIAIDGRAVSETAFARALEAAFEAADRTTSGTTDQGAGPAPGGPGAFTEFELLTAAALWHFREERVDWASLEVGMGGRWDATSVVSPVVSVVTGVALDHTERLGATREAIAADKAHVIKPGSIAVIGPGCVGVEDVLLQRIRMVGTPVVRVAERDGDVRWERTALGGGARERMRIAVRGRFGVYDGIEIAAPAHHAANIATALAAAECALGGPLDTDAVRSVFAAFENPGRFEFVRTEPPIVLDGAHNPEAASVLASALIAAFGPRGTVIVLGVLADKDAEGIVRALRPAASAFVCARSPSPRALAPERLAAVVAAEGRGVPCSAEPDIAVAVSQARDLAGEGPVVVTGSLYTVGAARAALVGEKG